MKKYIYSIIMMLTVTVLSAQCDIYTGGITTKRSTLKSGEQTELTFDVKNKSVDKSCAYKEESVMVYFYLPTGGLDFEEIVYPEGGKGTYFTWEYNAAHKVLIGVNHKAIGGQEGESHVTVRLQAKEVSQSAEYAVGLTILQNPEGAIFPSNDPLNDNSTLKLMVETRRSSVDMGTWTLSNSSCNEVLLNFETKSEYDNAEMHIQRSTDKVNYETIGRIKGTNRDKITSYAFVDNNDLKQNTVYYYRIEQLNTIGKAQYINIGSIENQCTDTSAELSVYPNPAFDKLYLTISNMKASETLSLVITNAAGEQVMDLPEVSASRVNEVKIQHLVPGLYNIASPENKAGTKRFIKIE